MAPGSPILTVPAYVLALAYAVSVVVSGLKDGIESVLPATNRWHDLFFTLLPVALCLVSVVGYTLTQPGHHPAGAVFMSVIWGTLAGFGAIGGYLLHTRTGTSPEQVVPTPAAALDLPKNAVHVQTAAARSAPRESAGPLDPEQPPPPPGPGSSVP